MESAKNFSDLDDYMKLDIFEYLKGSDLKNCMQVCSGWRNLIGRSSTLMRKFKLKLRGAFYTYTVDNMAEKLKAIEDSKLEFQHLLLQGLVGSLLGPMNAVSLFSEHLKIVELNQVTFASEEMFFELLGALDKLKKLLIFKVKAPPSSKDEVVPTLKFKLEKLVLVSMDKHIVKSLVKAKVQAKEVLVGFKPFDYGSSSVIESVPAVVNLLNCQKNLVNLSIVYYELDGILEVYQQLNAKMKEHPKVKLMVSKHFDSLNLINHLHRDQDFDLNEYM